MKRIVTWASIALIAIGAAACTREKPPVIEPTPTIVVGQAITPALPTTIPGGVASPTVPAFSTPAVGTTALPPAITTSAPTTVAAASPTTSTAVKPGATSPTSAPTETNPSTLGMATAVPPPAGTGTGAPTTYTVEWGDWLNKIAAKFGVTTQAILAANPGLVANRIYPGQVINIPAGGTYSPPVAPGATETPGQANPPATSPGTYTVQRGDWIYAIARKFGVSVAALEAANPSINPNRLYPGQVLNIPGATTPGEPATTPGSGQSYTVKAGDTLYTIAVRLGKTVYELQIANHLPNPNAIYPGQKLIIP